MPTDSDPDALQRFARGIDGAWRELMARERRKMIEARKARFRRRVEAIRQRIAAWTKWR